MSDRAWIQRIWQDGETASKALALATVVKVKGSAYRREGAKMLIDEAGHFTGLISGGCLEADVAEIAKGVIQSRTPIRKTYVMDEDLVWGLGLGCPGTVELLIEPLDPYFSAGYLSETGGAADATDTADTDGHPPERTGGSLAAFREWSRAVLSEQAGVLLTRLDTVSAGGGTVPQRLYVSEQGKRIGSLGHPELDRLAMVKAAELFRLQNPKASTQIIQASESIQAEIFIDVYMPPIDVVIFGAGHDAIPLARTSVNLGLRTIVVDPRPGYNTAERFPGAIRLLTDEQQAYAPLQIGRRSYIVIMNHHLERDLRAIRHCLQSEAPYIGVLGPRQRCQKILNQIAQEYEPPNPERLAVLYNPVGLDIGAGSPEEIALSIVSEILAVRNGHNGQFLRGKERIHQPSCATPVSEERRA